MQRKQYTAEYKAKLVLKVLSGEQTLAEIAKKHEIHPMVLAKWKKHAVEELSTVFEREGGSEHKEM
ncbi:MAG: transposase [Chitinivibrionales bacterium]|nr:transposase [Chitinivibrionales bacterium]